MYFTNELDLKQYNIETYVPNSPTNNFNYIDTKIANSLRAAGFITNNYFGLFSFGKHPGRKCLQHVYVLLS